MKSLFFKIKYLLPVLILANTFNLKADYYTNETKKSSEDNSEFLIESNNQKSDLENSIFYADGNVIITNTDKEFIAKSKKAIFYKLSGKMKLIGNVEVITSDANIIKAAEIIYFIKENRFEAISDQNQRVNTKFSLDNNLINNQE